MAGVGEGDGERKRDGPNQSLINGWARKNSFTFHFSFKFSQDQGAGPARPGGGDLVQPPFDGAS